MVKKWIVLVVLLLCVPAQADSISSWVWGDEDSLGVRIGSEVSKDIEVGLSALWLPDQEKPEIWGIYAIYYLPEIVQFPNPIELDFLPKVIGGRPYFGGKADIDFDIEKASVSPIAGIVFNKVIFIEYQFESFDREAISESKLVGGLRIEY